jgi:hypothetical protein
VGTNNISIHPRSSVFGHGPKLNTTKPRSRAKLERQLRGVEGHLEKHPGDLMSQGRVNIIKAILSEMR